MSFKPELSTNTQRGGVVPFHSHVLPGIAKALPSVCTRFDGTTITLIPGHEHTVILNANATITLPDMTQVPIPVDSNAATPGEGFGQGQFNNQPQIASNGAYAMRDEFNSVPTFTHGQPTMLDVAGFEVGAFVLQDDTGGWTVTWGTSSNRTGITVPGWTPGSGLSVPPQPPTSPFEGTYYRFRWLGQRGGWLLSETNPNLFPAHGPWPTSAGSNCPTYVRGVARGGFTGLASGLSQWNSYCSGDAVALFSRLALVPQFTRKFLYNNGVTYEENDAASTGTPTILLGNTSSVLSLTDQDIDYGPYISCVALSATHETGHAVDALLFKNGYTITYPDNGTYYCNGTPFGEGSSVKSNMSGQSRRIYFVQDHPTIQNLYNQAYATWKGGPAGASGTWPVDSDMTSTASYSMTGNKGYAPGQYRCATEWLAQNFMGYCRYLYDGTTTGDGGTGTINGSTVTWGDTFEASVPASLVSSCISFWQSILPTS